MNQFEINAEKYWNERYGREGRIWGEGPSRLVYMAIHLFGAENANYILVPGCGYGRMASVFSNSGFTVAGVDIAGTALDMAREIDQRGVYYQASALKMDFDHLPYDAVFAYNVLHLMLAEDRQRMIQECRRKLKDGGLMFFSVFSEQEEDYGKGQKVEENTFESRPGRPAHYFTDQDLRAHFQDFKLIESGLIEEPEDHGGKPHTHLLRYIAVKV
jgi:SAM-dependent methyltransferase